MQLKNSVLNIIDQFLEKSFYEYTKNIREIINNKLPYNFENLKFKEHLDLKDFLNTLKKSSNIDFIFYFQDLIKNTYKLLLEKEKKELMEILKEF